MSPKRWLFSFLLVVAGVLILAGTFIFYMHTRLPAPAPAPAQKISAGEVPRQITGLPLTQEIGGQDAIDSIHQLHGKDFTLAGGSVAVYGDQNATLWVSDAGSESAAANLMDLMKARIATGNSPFADKGSFEVDSYLIYALGGMGQVNYYWQSGPLVLWLAVNNDRATSALLEVVQFYSQ